MKAKWRGRGLGHSVCVCVCVCVCVWERERERKRERSLIPSIQHLLLKPRGDPGIKESIRQVQETPQHKEQETHPSYTQCHHEQSLWTQTQKPVDVPCLRVGDWLWCNDTNSRDPSLGPQKEDLVPWASIGVVLKFLGSVQWTSLTRNKTD